MTEVLIYRYEDESKRDHEPIFDTKLERPTTDDVDDAEIASWGGFALDDFDVEVENGSYEQRRYFFSKRTGDQVYEAHLLDPL